MCLRVLVKSTGQWYSKLFACRYENISIGSDVKVKRFTNWHSTIYRIFHRPFSQSLNKQRKLLLMNSVIAFSLSICLNCKLEVSSGCLVETDLSHFSKIATNVFYNYINENPIKHHAMQTYPYRRHMQTYLHVSVHIFRHVFLYM